MDPDTIEKSIISVWEAFVAGPYPSLAVFVPAVTLVWFAAKSFYKQQIVTLKDRGSTKDERLALMREKLEAAEKDREASEKALRDVKEEFSQYQEAVLQDAADKDQPVSPSVFAANTATENAMERLEEKEGEFSVTFEGVIAEFLAERFPESKDVLSADDLIVIGAEDKDKDKDKD